MNINEMIECKKCTGCMACKQVCPVNAIKIVCDENGFEYPLVTDKCISCGKCISVCHAIKDIELCYYKKAYLSIAKDKKGRKKSSSGGIFFAIAKWIITEKKGIVYGAQIYGGFKVEHYRVDSLLELEKLQGSKYAQSSIRNTYNEVKADLENGLWVLYSGTPCQIAGLKSFLGTEYQNLVTIDLICKGVCSSELLKKEIESLANTVNGDDISDIIFRKKKWNHKTMFVLEFKANKKLYSVSHENSLYYTSFINELSYRESCYFCKYATTPRCSDITIGDSNIADKYYKFHLGEALSVMLLNTEKAIWLMKENLDNIDIMPYDIDEEIKVNRPLHKCSDKYKERMDFFKNVNNDEWNILKTIYVSPKDMNYRIKNIVKDILPKEIKAYIKGVLESGYKRK